MCVCETIGKDAAAVLFCDEHHRYFKGDKRLASVTSVIKTIMPVDYSAVAPEVLENANDRGVEIDALFSAYVAGNLAKIPKGTRRDVWEPDASLPQGLLQKLIKWWDGRKHGEVRSQVVMADSDIAGACDVLDGDTIYDLKCTYDVAATYHLQLAAYAELHFATFGRPAKKLAIIHCTKRYHEPKIITVDMVQAAMDWQTIRAAFFTVQRLSA